jgi:hypothetical protein
MDLLGFFILSVNEYPSTTIQIFLYFAKNDLSKYLKSESAIFQVFYDLSISQINYNKMIFLSTLNNLKSTIL